MNKPLSLAEPQTRRIIIGALVVLIFAVSVFTIHQFLNRDRTLYNKDGSICYQGPVIESTQENYESTKLNFDFQGYVPHGYGDIYTSSGKYLGKATFVNGHTRGPAELLRYGVSRKLKGTLVDEFHFEGYIEYYIYSKPQCQGDEYLLYQGYIDDTNGAFEGEGKLYYRWSDQVRYEGIFKQDRFVEGAYYDKDGNLVKEGKFDPPDPGGTVLGEEE